jgi:hypothetical protein
MSSKKSKLTYRKLSPSPLVERGWTAPKVRDGGEDFKAFRILKKLNTPQKIQDYLDKMPFNFEEEGESYYSPAEALRQGKAHCFEGACLAAAAIHINKLGRPLLLDLKIDKKFIKQDADHALAIFKTNGFWGAISKTNHTVLGYRDPIYKSVRELAASYFHEYFISNGYKVLMSFSIPFDISKRFGDAWIESEEELDKVAEALDKSPHWDFYPRQQQKYLRKASLVQRKYASIALSKRNNNKK